MIFSSSFSPAATGPIYCSLFPEEYQQDYGQDKEYVQDSGVVENIKQCMDTPVTRHFMDVCHGQKHCNLTASPHMLGAQGCGELFVYLKTVYTCVNLGEIKDEFVVKMKNTKET